MKKIIRAGIQAHNIETDQKAKEHIMSVLLAKVAGIPMKRYLAAQYEPSDWTKLILARCKIDKIERQIIAEIDMCGR